MSEEDGFPVPERLQPQPSGLPFLPEDVFFIIIQLLEPVQVVRCRRVSKSWQNAFSSHDALRLALRCWYPKSYDVRAFDLLVQVPRVDAVDVFDRVASRYHNIQRGRPWKIEKYRMHLDDNPEDPLCYPVAPWERHTTDPPQEGRPFRFQQPFWTVQGDYAVFLDHVGRRLRFLNLSTRYTAVVPLSLHRKIIRNVRLNDDILVLEWAESAGSHHLNEDEVVHRHYATFFSVSTQLKETRSFESSSPEIKITFRNELKLHFFGLPLNKRDRFFSYHNQQHYAIYFWQPNRSMYTGDEEAPIESLHVWDISDHCNYQPSVDPSGHDKPPGAGPEQIMGLGFRELDFYDVRQRDIPSFTGIEVDADNVYVNETPNLLIQLQQNSPPFWHSRTVSIPLKGLGPHEIYQYSRGMSVTEVLDKVARVKHTVDSQHKWPARIDPHSLTLSTSTARGSPVQLSQDLVPQVIASGQIAGDESKIIGQNEEGELVVLWFDAKPSVWERSRQFEEAQLPREDS